MEESQPRWPILVAKAKWASMDARSAAQSVKGLVFSAAVGAASGFAASRTDNPSIVLVLGAALLGVLAPLLVVFLWSFLTIPRRHLEWRINELEQTVESLQGQISNLLQEKHGDPMQFLPIYHELRADIREARRILERALQTGRLWARTDAPEYRNWKRSRENIATSPWARIDGIHGELLEAFDHIERLASSTAMRFGSGRKVKASDDLEVAIDSLTVAEDRLNFSINRLEQLQTPPELWQGEDVPSDEPE